MKKRESKEKWNKNMKGKKWEKLKEKEWKVKRKKGKDEMEINTMKVENGWKTKW